MRASCSFVTAALLCALLAGSAQAESLDTIFSAANEAYFRGDFATAVKGYEQLEQAGVRDADVSFNLATAYARQGKLGAAVLGFSRALWLRPGDDGAEEGLSAAQDELAKRRADRVGEAELRTRPPLAEALVRPISADGLALAMLLMSTLFFGCLGALTVLTRSGPSWRSASRPRSLPRARAVQRGSAGEADGDARRRPGIVLREGAPLREGPDDKAPSAGSARRPSRARPADRRRPRKQSRQRRRGWMDIKDLGRLRPE